MTGQQLWESYRVICRISADVNIPPWQCVPASLRAWWNSIARKMNEGKPTKRSRIMAMIEGAKTSGERRAAELALDRVEQAASRR